MASIHLRVPVATATSASRISFSRTMLHDPSDARYCEPGGSAWTAAAPCLLPLIWPANDCPPMGSNTACPVGAMSATNRTVAAITVMVRIWFANSHSPMGSDASRPVDTIDTSGCVTWLGEHERPKRNHDGEQKCAPSTEALCNVFHF